MGVRKNNAKIQLYMTKDAKWTYVRKIGNEDVVCKYDNIGYFHEGLADVERDEKWGFIDETGEEVIACQYDTVYSYNEGLAGVEKDGKWGFIDKKGKEVIACQYDSVEAFNGSLAIVERNGKCAYIDKTGNIITCLHEFENGTIKLKDIPVEYLLNYSFRKQLISISKDRVRQYANNECDKLVSEKDITDKINQVTQYIGEMYVKAVKIKKEKQKLTRMQAKGKFDNFEV